MCEKKKIELQAFFAPLSRHLAVVLLFDDDLLKNEAGTQISAHQHESQRQHPLLPAQVPYQHGTVAALLQHPETFFRDRLHLLQKLIHIQMR